jgi:hypothetical protein
MRRISAFTTIGVVLASLAIQATAAGATAHNPRGRHHGHAAARAHRPHPATTSRHAARHARHRTKIQRSAAARMRAVRAETRKAKRLQARAATASARLRALTAGHAGCLSSLDPQSRTLLTLRTGLNGSPRSVADVAQALGISTLREQLLEQISVLELHDATGGTCAGHAAGDTLRPEIRLTSTAPWLTRSSA